jgi:hypothetical protein
MATTTKTASQKATATTATATTVSTVDDERLNRLEKENAELKDQLTQLIALMTAKGEEEKATTKATPATIVEEVSNDVPDEPSPNKMIRILSLCRGSLNLARDESGNGKVNFSKYGEVKTVLYSSLVDIVNYNRSFAETGKFYILDKAAVYYLGLKDVYTRLVTNDVLDNICNYEDVDIDRIISTTEESQIETMVKNLVDKIYNGATVDLNKVQIISKATGVDIMAKVNEMRSFVESSKVNLTA